MYNIQCFSAAYIVLSVYNVHGEVLCTTFSVLVRMVKYGLQHSVFILVYSVQCCVCEVWCTVFSAVYSTVSGGGAAVTQCANLTI